MNATITECLSVLKSHDALVVIILIMMILIMVIMIMIIPIVMIMIIVIVIIVMVLMRGRVLLLVCTIPAACQGFSLPKRLQPYIIILCRFK